MALMVAVCVLVGSQFGAAQLSVEYSAVNGGNLNSWSNTMYIPHPDGFIPANTKLLGFQYIALRSATMYMQLFRPTGPGIHVYTLIASVKHVAYAAGEQKVMLESFEPVFRGDCIGFYFPAQGVVPFTGRESCNFAIRTLYSRPSIVSVGYSYMFTLKQTTWKHCSQCLFKAITDSTGCSGVSPPHNRSYLDSWSDAMYIPYPDTYLQVSTNAIAFAYYARASADVYLQVFRPAGYMKYTLVASVPHRTRTAGLQTVKITLPRSITKEDRVGFYIPSQGLDEFGGSESCNLATRGLYVRAPSFRIGVTYSFARVSGGLNPCKSYVFMAYAIENTDIVFSSLGNEAVSRPYLESHGEAMYIPNPNMYFPAPTRLIGFQYYAKRAGPIYLQILRQVGFSNKYQLIYITRHNANFTDLKTLLLPTPVFVLRGDRIGFWLPERSTIPYTDTEGCNLDSRSLFIENPTVRINDAYTFERIPPRWRPCRHYSLKAITMTTVGGTLRSASGENRGVSITFKYIYQMHLCVVLMFLF